MFNIGIVKIDKRILKRLEKAVKAAGIDCESIGMIRLAVEHDEAMNNRPGAFFVIDSLDHKQLAKLPLREVLPDGWHKKEPLGKRLNAIIAKVRLPSFTL